MISPFAKHTAIVATLLSLHCTVPHTILATTPKKANSLAEVEQKVAASPLGPQQHDLLAQITMGSLGVANISLGAFGIYLGSIANIPLAIAPSTSIAARGIGMLNTLRYPSNSRHFFFTIKAVVSSLCTLPGLLWLIKVHRRPANSHPHWQTEKIGALTLGIDIFCRWWITEPTHSAPPALHYFARNGSFLSTQMGIAWLWYKGTPSQNTHHTISTFIIFGALLAIYFSNTLTGTLSTYAI